MIRWIIRSRQCPNIQSWSSSDFTLEFMDEFEPSNTMLWLWVSLIFVAYSPNAVSVSCSIMFRGDIAAFGIFWTLRRGIIRAYPCLISSVISFFRNVECFWAPLWFPNFSPLLSPEPFALDLLVPEEILHHFQLLISGDSRVDGVEVKVLTPMSGGILTHIEDVSYY